MKIRRKIAIFFAVFLLLVGIVFKFTPVPGTTLMIIFSVTYLISVSDRATFYIKHLRKKSKAINNFFAYIEKHTKEKTRNTLNATDPKTIIMGESCAQFKQRMTKERET